MPTQAELAVIAALGASFLTGLASLGVVAFQEHRRGKGADRDALTAAVVEMLSRSIGVSTRAQALAETMRSRSGLGEGVDVASRLRKAADILEMHDWMAQDMAPLNAAWSVVWARAGDQQTVRLANALLAACSDLVGAGSIGPATSYWERIRRYVLGERWTPEQRAEVQRHLTAVAHARKALTEHARRNLGKPAVELFGHDEELATATTPELVRPAALEEGGN